MTTRYGVSKILAVLISLLSGLFWIGIDVGLALFWAYLLIWSEKYTNYWCVAFWILGFSIALQTAHKHYKAHYTSEHAPRWRVFLKIPEVKRG